MPSPAISSSVRMRERCLGRFQPSGLIGLALDIQVAQQDIGRAGHELTSG